MKLPAFIFLLFFAIGMNGQTISRTARFDAERERFQKTFAAELKAAGIAGGSFVFIKDGRVAARELYGAAHLEKNQPVAEETIFHWASNTKPLTGIAMTAGFSDQAHFTRVFRQFVGETPSAWQRAQRGRSAEIGKLAR